MVSGLPLAAQTMLDDWRSVSQWQKTAMRAEALLDLPLVRRDHITIDQWEDLRLDLTVQREQALILSDRGTLKGRIARAQLADLDTATPKGQSEPDWAKQKRGELNRKIASEEGPAIAARDIEARNGVLVREIDQILRQKRRQKLFSHSYPFLAANTWAVAIRDLRSGRVNLGQHTMVRQPYPELVGVPLTVRLALVIGIAIAAAWIAERGRRALRSAIDRLGTYAGSPRRVLGLAFARDLLDIAMPAAVLLIVLASVTVLTADLPFMAALSGQMILAGLTVIFARWLGQSIFNPAFAPAQLVSIPERGSETAIRLMTLLGFAMAADSLVDYVDQQPGNSASAAALASFFIVVVAGFLTWRLARVLKGATGARSEAGEGSARSPRANRATDMVQPAARAITLAAALAIVVGIAGYVPLGRYVLTSTLMSLAVVCTSLFLYRSLTEASELLFHKSENSGSRYLQLLPLAFGFILFFLTVAIVAVMWGISGENILDGILALKNGVEVGQIRVSFGSVMTFALVFLLGYALTRWLQRVLHFAVLDRLHIEAGARNAVLTGFGYLGLTLSALVAITAAASIFPASPLSPARSLLVSALACSRSSPTSSVV